jgi:hypothetical protein
MTTKSNNILHWSLAGVVGFIFIGSAMSKFFGGDESMQMAQGIGLSAGTFKLLGLIELISVILFIIPRTAILGTVLLTAYMGGAIATHLTHGQPVMAPVIIEAIIVVVAFIRIPELKNRLLNAQV